MSNWINRTLTSTMLAAALGGVAAPDAEAGNYRDQRNALNQELTNNCYTVGQQKGVVALPLTKKAYQQDRDLGVGCTFSFVAGEFLVEKAFDLSQGAAGYTNATNALENKETAKRNQLIGQANRGQPRSSGNSFVDGLNDLNQVLQGTNKVINQTGQNATGIGNGRRAVESISNGR